MLRCGVRRGAYCCEGIVRGNAGFLRHVLDGVKIDATAEHVVAHLGDVVAKLDGFQCGAAFEGLVAYLLYLVEVDVYQRGAALEGALADGGADAWYADAPHIRHVAEGIVTDFNAGIDDDVAYIFTIGVPGSVFWLLEALVHLFHLQCAFAAERPDAVLDGEIRELLVQLEFVPGSHGIFVAIFGRDEESDGFRYAAEGIGGCLGSAAVHVETAIRTHGILECLAADDLYIVHIYPSEVASREGTGAYLLCTLKPVIKIIELRASVEGVVSNDGGIFIYGFIRQALCAVRP